MLKCNFDSYILTFYVFNQPPKPTANQKEGQGPLTALRMRKWTLSGRSHQNQHP